MISDGWREMAVAICAACAPLAGKRVIYVLACEPLGYPGSAVICCVSGCENPALIWLTAWEAGEYRNGRRILGVSGRLPKVGVGVRQGEAAAEAA